MVYLIAIRTALRMWRWILVLPFLSSCAVALGPASSRDESAADKLWHICRWTLRGDCELLSRAHAQEHVLTARESDLLDKLAALTIQDTLSDQAIVDALGVPDSKAEPEVDERLLTWLDPVERVNGTSISLTMDRQQLVGISYSVPGKFAAIWHNPDAVASRSRRREIISDHAYLDFRILADRFNRELAGRYPFGPAQSPDASLLTVRAFFADYASQSSTLKANVATTLKRPGSDNMLRFLAQLDQAAAFLGSCLRTDGAGPPMTVEPRFRMMPKASSGSDQVVNWTLLVGAQAVSHPNPSATTKLGWSCGQHVMLELNWARASAWRPVRPEGDAAHDLRTDEFSATFVSTGDWALLRMIEAHPPQARLLIGSQQDPLWKVLEFRVPTQRMTSTRTHQGKGNKATRSEARLYLGLSHGTWDPTTGAPQPLNWPERLPRLAPLP